MNNKNLFLIVFFTLFVFIQQIYSQIPDYAQIHTNYIYINPAFAGINSCPKFYTAYRNKYKAIYEGYSTSYMSYDLYSTKLKSNIGFSLIRDVQGNIFYTTGVSAIYAKEIQLQRKLFLSMAIEPRYMNFALQNSALIYSDMIDPLSDGFGISQEEQLSYNDNKFDVDAGILLYNENYFGGITAKHIQEKFSKKNSRENRLSSTISMHGGCEFSTTKGFTQRYLIWFYPQVNITLSETSSYMQLGMIAQKSKVQFGMAYRQNFPSDAESFIVFVGFVEKKFKFAYNCDVSINSQIENNFNSHEISLGYLFNCKEKKKKYGAVKAPVF